MGNDLNVAARHIADIGVFTVIDGARRNERDAIVLLAGLGEDKNLALLIDLESFQNEPQTTQRIAIGHGLGISGEIFGQLGDGIPRLGLGIANGWQFPRVRSYDVLA